MAYCFTSCPRASSWWIFDSCIPCLHREAVILEFESPNAPINIYQRPESKLPICGASSQIPKRKLPKMENRAGKDAPSISQYHGQEILVPYSTTKSHGNAKSSGFAYGRNIESRVVLEGQSPKRLLGDFSTVSWGRAITEDQRKTINRATKPTHASRPPSHQNQALFVHPPELFLPFSLLVFRMFVHLAPLLPPPTLINYLIAIPIQ